MSAGPVFVTGGSGMLGRRVIAALVADGRTVRALARSGRSSAAVAAAGAKPILGDLADLDAVRAGLAGCTSLVHCAARMEGGGQFSAYVADNLTGTKHMLDAAAAAGVARFVHVGAAMSLLGSAAIDGADETWPLHEPKCSGYVRTKTLADRAVRAAATDEFTTIVIRPAWVWGSPDDPQLLAIAGAVRAGRMRLIDHGRHEIVTSHIDNVVSAIVLALDHGEPGAAYYVFDDAPITIKDFLSGLMRTQGLDLPRASIPAPLARALASAMETTWKVLRRPGTPPITRLLVALSSRPFLVSDQLARTELGYQPVIARTDGLSRLHAATPN